jgi:uncharacterized protein
LLKVPNNTNRATSTHTQQQNSKTIFSNRQNHKDFMSKKIYLLLLALSIFIISKAQDIPAKPNPPRLVNDFVMKLNPNELQALEQKLRGYADSTSTQITIVIVKNTGDSDPYDYAIKLAKDWGVGQKDKNNGLVLLWATETRKLRIVTGRGMEATITDAISKRIINTILKPYFQAGQFYQGLNEATSEIMRRASGEFQADPKDDSDDSVIPIIFIILIIIVIFIFISSRNGGGRNRGRGFNSGGGGWMGPVIFTSGGSSGWGGSSGGGDGGGFDFGGFGGGDFGGGGAGGDY